MAVRHAQSLSLRYGDDQCLQLHLSSSRIARRHRPPEAVADFADLLREQLAAPLDFPPLEMAVVPGDRIVIALERHTPAADQIIAGLWSEFQRRSIQPQNVTILQPASWRVGQLPDPRTALPDAVRHAIRWVIHDATEKSREKYLANSAVGERIYLAREIVDADFVLPVGSIAFDPLVGIRSASSALFPGLSNVHAMSKARGQDHVELQPEDERPLRQLQDEIAWLLGVQYGIHVLPGVGGRPAGVLCGALDAVTSAARLWLKQHWQIKLAKRCEVVVAAVDFDNQEASWEHLGAALQTARNLVQNGGTILLLTTLAQDPTEGFQMLRQCESPREALKPLRLESPPDLIPVSRLASAADWATVYLLSRLPDDVVESLFLTPLASEAEASRLLDRGGSCLLIEGAQHTFGYVA